MPSQTRRAVSSAVIVALVAGHWPTSAAYAACGGTTGGGSGPPSISATEVSTSQALQIMRRRQDEALAAASGGGGGNVSVASLSPPPPPPQPAPQVVTPPKPKPVAKVVEPKPAPKVVEAKPAPKVVEAKPEVKPAPEAKPAPDATPAPEAKAEPAKPADTTNLPKAGGEIATPAPGATTDADKSVTAEAPKAVDTTNLPKAGGKITVPSPAATVDADKSVGEPKVKKPARSVVAYDAPRKAPAVSAPEPRSYGSVKDDYVPAAGPTRAAWAQGFYDYERQGGWTPDRGEPGSVTSTEHTAGMLAGGDVTFRAPHGAGSSLTVGVLGGYSESRTSYNDVTLTSDRNDPGKGTDTYLRSGARDTTEGGSVGAYGLFVHNTTTIDLLVKADLLDFRQKDNVTVVASECGNNGTFPLGTIFDRENTADLTSVVVAGNIANRYMLTRNSWLEPVVGFRYTHLDYSNVKGFSVPRNWTPPAAGGGGGAGGGAGGGGGGGGGGGAGGGGGGGFTTVPPVLDIGVSDGDMFRVQGGVRYGFAHVLAGDRLWVTTVGGFLYSDVWIGGLSKDYRDVEEGKLRAMGQLTTALSDRDGMTYLLQLEVRGGDDMIGFNAKGGVRYDW